MSVSACENLLTILKSLRATWLTGFNKSIKTGSSADSFENDQGPVCQNAKK